MIRTLTIIAVCLALLSCASPRRDTQTNEHGAIQNLHKLTDRLYSGAEPVGELAYEQLASLGVRAVISVDAVAPNKQLADRYGIRVIHLPIGYDGVPEDRAHALAKAIVTIDGPIFVNCHHGKHRGPAALVVGGIGAGEITGQQGRAYLEAAGTSLDYPGLWEAIGHVSAYPMKDLNAESVLLPERSEPGGFAETMSQIDRAHEQLWLCADNGFVAPADHPDLAPVSLAGQIHDMLRSLEADPYAEQEGELFAMLLAQSIEIASDAETQIRSGRPGDALDSLSALGDSCVDCHNKYRD